MAASSTEAEKAHNVVRFTEWTPALRGLASGQDKIAPRPEREAASGLAPSNAAARTTA
jgi:hypothetical protein